MTLRRAKAPKAVATVAAAAAAKAVTTAAAAAGKAVTAASIATSTKNVDGLTTFFC